MDIKNCPSCGKIFVKMDMPICEDCIKKEENAFDSVKKYIEEHPDKPISVVSEDTGVSLRKILNYIKEGRLEVSSGLEGELKCEQCGNPIEKGSYCEKCLVRINSMVTGFLADEREKNKIKSTHTTVMHTNRNRRP